MTVAVIREPTKAPMRRVASPETRRSVNLMKFRVRIL